MATLLSLTPKKRNTLFMNKMKELAFNSEKEKTCYCVSSRDQDFTNINLNNLVFVANNVYELWLIVYSYLNKHIDRQKQVISMDRVSSKGEILLNYKNLPDDEDDEKFQMYDDADIIDTIEFLMEDDADDSVKIEDVVEEVIEDFFKNDYFWAREINDNDYTTDSDEDEDD